jgi:hypothetical protein
MLQDQGLLLLSLLLLLLLHHLQYAQQQHLLLLGRMLLGLLLHMHRPQQLEQQGCAVHCPDARWHQTVLAAPAQVSEHQAPAGLLQLRLPGRRLAAPCCHILPGLQAVRRHTQPLLSQQQELDGTLQLHAARLQSPVGSLLLLELHLLAQNAAQQQAQQSLIRL